jgi:Ceramidase
MDWGGPVMDYCERQDHGFWAEPLNAWTNLAFALAAAAAFDLWRRRGAADYPVLALILVTLCVGAGSFVFHTVATRGAALLDVIPIAVFIYGYFWLALRRFFGLPAAASLVATMAFALASHLVDARVQGLNGSVGYLPALAAMAVFAALLFRRSRRAPAARPESREAARGLALAALVFFVSLCFRSMDRAVCATAPFGAHFLWHGLNALVLWVLLRTAIQAAPSQKAKVPTAACEAATGQMFRVKR